MDVINFTIYIYTAISLLVVREPTIDIHTMQPLTICLPWICKVGRPASK